MTAPTARTYSIAFALRKFVVDSGVVGTVKDPAAVLDYAFDWTAWLTAASSPADTIASYVLTVEEREAEDKDPDDESDLVIDAHSRSGAVVTLWLSEGFVGSRLMVTCHITTAGGRQDERSISVAIEET